MAMRRRNEYWTALDLELFHDEELEDARLYELNDELRLDDHLRARLANVRQLNDSLREVLLCPRPISMQTIRWRPAAALTAASLILLYGAVVWYQQPAAPGPLVVENEQSSEPEYRPIRIVFSLAVPGDNAVSPPRSQPRMSATRLTATTPDDGVTYLRRLDRALASQDIQAALDLIVSAPAEQQRMAYARLGQMLRSAHVAELILDSLGPPEQLAVCDAWAREPHLRPIVFSRLQHLAVDDSMAEKLQVLVSDFSHDPELRAWLRAYQFDNRT
jgi:hypothetical protein